MFVQIDEVVLNTDEVVLIRKYSSTQVCILFKAYGPDMSTGAFGLDKQSIVLCSTTLHLFVR
jgi:hypothetical protein